MTATANVSNTWLYADGDFVSQSTGLFQTFPLEVDYYFGSDSDGAWSEGGPATDVFVSALPPDDYNMRLEVQWEHWQQPMTLTVRVDQGVPRMTHLLLAVLFVSIIPMAVMIQHFSGFKHLHPGHLLNASILSCRRPGRLKGTA